MSEFIWLIIQGRALFDLLLLEIRRMFVVLIELFYIDTYSKVYFFFNLL